MARGDGASAPPDNVLAPRGFADRLLGWRDGLLSSARFQRWAAAFPLTRPIANRRARALFDLCAGFVYSQILVACVRLRVCDILLERPLTGEHLAARLALPVDPTLRLLEAAAALRLVERRRDGRFGVGPLGAPLAGNPGIAAMVEHHALLYADLRDPVAMLRGDRGGTALSRFWPYAAAPCVRESRPADVTGYSALMAASQPLVAADVLAAYRFDRHRCLLDLGSGDGTFLTAVAEAAPALRLILFDLPDVAAHARARFAGADRVQVVGGDFRHDPLPEGADLVSLIRVIHDHDDAVALAILRAAWRAMAPGATLLLAEPMAGTPNAEPVGAYFAVYLLAMGSGRPRRAEELLRLVREAGFTGARVVPTRRPMLVRVVTARR